ncbi:hypothetical protein OIU84_019121 [Salix udensis]|uniref:Uncharacterized protein n=1 Tax=Salix udensis TaxID=889485 RepID=A0AAD6KYE1_9ROSI|nr:hypothetical protein OIU84_019121 [Salix udensis]
MEESLLLSKKRSEVEGRERLALTRDVFTREAKKLAYIAGPMVVTTTSLYMLLVGGSFGRASAAISVSFCNVTGMSLLMQKLLPGNGLCSRYTEGVIGATGNKPQMLNSVDNQSSACKLDNPCTTKVKT